MRAINDRKNNNIFKGIILYATGVMFGALLMMELTQVPEYDNEQSNSVSGNLGTVVASDARTECLLRFSACGHYVELDPPETAGMTRKEISENYSEYNIEIFDVDLVRLSKSVDAYCPEHYMIKAGDNCIIITRADSKNGLQKEVMRLMINLEGFDSDTLSEIKKGRAFDSLEEINTFLEGGE